MEMLVQHFCPSTTFSKLSSGCAKKFLAFGVFRSVVVFYLFLGWQVILSGHIQMKPMSKLDIKDRQRSYFFGSFCWPFLQEVPSHAKLAWRRSDTDGRCWRLGELLLWRLPSLRTIIQDFLDVLGPKTLAASPQNKELRTYNILCSTV